MNKKLFGILACPKSNTALVYEKKSGELISPESGLAYPLRDGIPVLLVEEARALSQNELQKYQ